MISPERKLELDNRLASIKALGLNEEPWFVVLEAGVQASFTQDKPINFLDGRYLLVKECIYNDAPNTQQVECCDTLEEAELSILEHIFQASGNEHVYDVRVYDLNLTKQLDYEIVKIINWRLSNGY